MEKSSISSFLRNTSGSTAIMFALSSLILLGAAGAAIDYGRTLDAKTRLDGYADASALAAAQVTSKATKSSDSVIMADAKKVALDIWKVNVKGETSATTDEPVVNLVKKNKTWTTSVSYKAKLKTSLMGALNINTVSFTGKSVATAGVEIKDNWQFTLAVDTSSSMGIGATQQDMDRMQADPNIGCMFACHFNAGGGTVWEARNGGYKLRLDVVSDSVDASMKMLEETDGLAPKVSVVGITTKVTELVPMTKDLSKVKQHQIEIALAPASVGNTDLKATMGQLTSRLGKSGNGSSEASPKKALILITDGIHDTTFDTSNVVLVPTPGTHHLGTVDPNFCSQLKQNGNLVGVLYINYIIPADYFDWVNPFAPSVLPSLQACASPGMFVNAKDSSQIEKALKDIIGAALSSEVRLSE